MSSKKIIIIEDEEDILEIIDYNLKKEGFKTLSSSNGSSGLNLIKKELPDGIILDLMLPGMDGLEICKELKSDPLTKNIPIIMLTAKSEESDIVIGLGLGADDYLKKPFSPKELIARIKAVLRRGQVKQVSEKSEQIHIHDLTIDTTRHEVKVKNKRIDLTATEFRLLHFLASHPGRVFSRDQLLSRAIGEGAVVIDRNVDVHIRVIRKKLGKNREYIETIRGVGYRFKDGS